MASTVNANDLTVVHRTSDGMAIATVPDVCKTPSPAGGAPVPVPYPNLAMSSDLVNGTTTVTVDGQMAAIQGSKFVKSTGDEAGAAGGVVSGVFIMEAEFISASPTVMMDGLPVNRLSDKMLMNHQNTVCLSGEVQPPLPPGIVKLPDSQKPEEPKVCVFEKLTLKCGHKERNYTLKEESGPDRTIQIVSDPMNPDKIKVGYNGRCGVSNLSPGCAKPHVIQGDTGKELELDSELSVALPPTESVQRWAGDWLTLVRNIHKLDHLPRDPYVVYGTACNGTGGGDQTTGVYANVEVFPKAGWSGDLSFGYQYEKTKRKKIANERDIKDVEFGQLDDQGKWELKGSFEGQYGRTTLQPLELTLSGDGAKKDSDPASRALFKSTQAVLTKLTRVLALVCDFSESKLDILWPNLKFGGGVELAEVETKAIVRPAGNFYFAADPLIGAKVVVDILEALVWFAAGCAGPGGPPFAKMLLKARTTLAGKKLPGAPEEPDKPMSASAEIGINLTIKGDVGGALGWTVKEGKVAIDGDKALIKASLGFTVEAYVKVEGKIFVIKAAAGASISLLGSDGIEPAQITGSLAPKGGKDFGIKGQLKGNGLAIYYALYLELGLSGDLAGGGGGDGAKPKKKSAFAGALKTQHTTKERQMLCEFMQPWTLPSQEEADNVIAACSSDMNS